MTSMRTSGILLHVTSLPSPYGIGDLGAEAVQFIEQLAAARQGLWQILPLGPTGYGNSPYQCYSAFAGNPLLIDLRELVREAWLTDSDIHPPGFPEDRVEFDAVALWRSSLLQRAHDRFQSAATEPRRRELASFYEQHEQWLGDFALFMALKEEHGGGAWTNWPRELIARERAALESARRRLARQMDFQVFAQWCFDRQWRAVKQHANRRGIRIIGDVPIFVAHDSADVWARQELFQLDGRGMPRVVAGVPPDYFSATGQLWGNPLYDWGRINRDGYGWWVARLKQALALFDYVRLDHFRGFEAYWEIPAGSTTAAPGRWVAGPGAALFDALAAQLGSLALIAEDLGVITPPVEALRDRFGYPGMRVLQFAFGEDPKAPDYRPHHFVPNCVVYTGTHDNDTTKGWFESQAGAGTTRTAAQIAAEREHTLRYVGTDGREIHWDMIRLAMASVANQAVFPMQDVLGLGREARMNMPSTLHGNWQWRMAAGRFHTEHQQRLRHLAETFDRGLHPASVD